MQYGDFIDSIADLRKLGIETSGLSRDDRELAKAKIDCFASILKVVQPFPEQNLNTININIEWVRHIKTIARKYFVDKVVLFPYPVNQNLIYHLRVYGGEKANFFEAIGLRALIASNNASEEYANMDQWEKEYGMILYDGF